MDINKSIRNKIEQLRFEIEKHDRLYYKDAMPIISDYEYDILLSDLEDLEKKYPQLITPNSPTQRVSGEPINAFNTIRHSIRMQSLSNTYSKEELKKFDERIQKLTLMNNPEYTLEPKIDGVAISLRYEYGQLIYAVTRGDGDSGDDVTDNIKTIKSIPLRLDCKNPPKVFEARGEIFFNRFKFLDYNKLRERNGDAPFANPRNACAGSLKLLDAKQVSKRPLDAVFYNVGEYNDLDIKSHNQLLGILKSFGFKIAPYFKVTDNFSLILEYLDELNNLSENFSFEIDGAVLKINDRSKYELLGETSKSPRWAVAYKYASEKAETIIRKITIQVGRTGVLTPVAELEPVPLAGTTIRRATLHNKDDIQKKDIRINDHVIIEKAGEIIPIVVKVIKEKRTTNSKVFNFPKFCPECGSKVEKTKSEAAIRCVNLQCKAQIKNWISHYVSRKAMDINELGDGTIDKLITDLKLQSPADLYALKYDDIRSLLKEEKDWVTINKKGKKSASGDIRTHRRFISKEKAEEYLKQHHKLDYIVKYRPIEKLTPFNLLESIKKSKQQPFAKSLFALGIRNVGAASANILSKKFLNIDELEKATSEELQELEDIGPIVADSIISFFSNPYTKRIVSDLKRHGVNFTSDLNENSIELKDVIFVLTGSLETMTRDEASDIIRSKGGKVSSSISKKTNYLITGNKSGSKLKKAEQLGVKILNESEFLKLINISH